MLGKLGKDRQEHTRISGQPTGNFQNDVVLGDGICLEGPHILPWLPESSLPFGLFGFDSTLFSESSLPFSSNTRRWLFPWICPLPLPLPKSPSFRQEELLGSLLFCDIQGQLQGRVLWGQFSGEGFPGLEMSDSPCPLSRDSWSRHLHIHLSRVTRTF